MTPKSRTLWRILLALGAVGLPSSGAPVLAQDQGRVVEVLPKAPPARRPSPPAEQPVDERPPVRLVDGRAPSGPAPSGQTLPAGVSPMETVEVGRTPVGGVATPGGPSGAAGEYAGAVSGIATCQDAAARVGALPDALPLLLGLARVSKDEFETRDQFSARALAALSARLSNASILVFKLQARLRYNAESQAFVTSLNELNQKMAARFNWVGAAGYGSMELFSYGPSIHNEINIRVAPEEARRIAESIELVLVAGISGISIDPNVYSSKFVLGPRCVFLSSEGRVLWTDVR